MSLLQPWNPFNCLTPTRDKHVTSPNNIHTSTCTQVIRILKLIRENLILIQHQILIATFQGDVLQLEGRINNQILGLKRVKLNCIAAIKINNKLSLFVPCVCKIQCTGSRAWCLPKGSGHYLTLDTILQLKKFIIIFFDRCGMKNENLSLAWKLQAKTFQLLSTQLQRIYQQGKLQVWKDPEKCTNT